MLWLCLFLLHPSCFPDTLIDPSRCPVHSLCISSPLIPPLPPHPLVPSVLLPLAGTPPSPAPPSSPASTVFSHPCHLLPLLLAPLPLFSPSSVGGPRRCWDVHHRSPRPPWSAGHSRFSWISGKWGGLGLAVPPGPPRAWLGYT